MNLLENNNSRNNSRLKIVVLAVLSMMMLFAVPVSYASKVMPGRTIYVAEWSRLKHLAAEGNPEAQFQLGNMYYLPPKHSGIPKNFVKAFDLFQQSAKQGHTTAQHNVAVMYYRGEGVKMNRATAIAWFMRAKNNGSKSAAKHLAELNHNLDEATQRQVQFASKQIQYQIQQAKTAK